MFKKKSYFNSCIFYGVIAILCLLGIQNLFPFFIIFSSLAALYGYFAYKHQNDKPHPLLQKIIDKRNARKRAKGQVVNGVPKTHKELKAEYKARLSEIENEFAFDYSDEETDEDDDDDYGE